MKILTAEEIKENKRQTLIGGVVGGAAGLAISGLLFRIVPKRYPHVNFKKLPWSLKTAAFIMPPTALMAICAEEASNRYDEERYRGARLEEIDDVKKKYKSEQTTWVNFIDALSRNQYKIITGAWAGSLYASWALINRDKIMTTAQKVVQARMYAQFITVGLLLGTIGLSVYEDKLHPNKHQILEKKRWEEVLKEAEKRAEREKLEKAQGVNFASNEDRIGAKIYKDL